MKKLNFKKLRLKNIKIHELDEKIILLNLAITQLIMLAVGIVLIMFQDTNSLGELLQMKNMRTALLWGAGFALIVLVADVAISRWVPEEVADDGGINKLIFKGRPLWQIVLICLAVAVCEELLFRGAVQHSLGPYWTSILFAAVHVRYLQHWLMTALVFGISYGMGWIYLQTGTLWTPIAAHFMIDLAMGCFIRYRSDD